MDKRRSIFKKLVFSMVMIAVYIFFVFPANHFVNDSNFLISSQIINEAHNEVQSVCVNHNIYGLLNVKTPIDRCAYIGGFPIAMALYTDGVILEEISCVNTAFGKVVPCPQLMKGDFLVELDGKKISSAKDVDEVLSNININTNVGWQINPKFNLDDSIIKDKSEEGFKEKSIEENNLQANEISAVVIRNGNRKLLKIKPALEEFSNFYRLGLVIRDYILGVGTVSFINEDGTFGALGHPVSDSIAGRVAIRGGHIFDCQEVGIVKGERGCPGELRVKINSIKNPIGVIYKNTDYGVFGKFDSLDNLFSSSNKDEKLYPIVARKKITTGEAYVYTTINGVTDLYSIEILKTINQIGFSDKGLIIKVTDKRLLDKTGGIVQGMSGSPILQNNMLVGALTHVFVKEPTKGYGIYIDFMYENK